LIIADKSQFCAISCSSADFCANVSLQDEAQRKRELEQATMEAQLAAAQQVMHMAKLVQEEQARLAAAEEAARQKYVLTRVYFSLCCGPCLK
jgi:hypothetical protein